MIASRKKLLIEFVEDYTLQTNKGSKPFKKGNRCYILINRGYQIGDIEMCDIEFIAGPKAFKVPYNKFMFIDED